MASGLSVWVCVRLFLRQIIYLSSPLPPLTLFPFPHPFKQPLGVLVRFKNLNSLSLCQKKLYTWSSFTESGGGITRRWSFLHSPKGDTLSLRYCICGTEQSQGPLLASGLLFWRFASGDLSLCRLIVGSVLSLMVQREYKRFWIDILGASLIHSSHWGIYHVGSKGQGGFSSVGSAYICKTLMWL